ncbi:ATP-grasp domain-containing protein [Streptomyces abyssomicinicus]|uniref:ATP-grasp domain-containing protein n=1 Tax=Streptomyces abyssomicinicus TaxID=574929 RepID=UPI00124F9737|nr:ATP-grasp domain-containing protein [Streptomyces abyssomicinicus]
MSTDLARYRFLVTGVGATPGLGLTRSLLRLGHQVVAADCDPFAPGFFLPGVNAQVIPHADDPAYGRILRGLCRQLRVDAIVSGIENDLVPLLALRSALHADGVRVWLPDAGSVHNCVDKVRFHQVLARHAIPTPRTWRPEEIDRIPHGTELIVKPATGHGAQHFHHVDKREHLPLLCDIVPRAIVQERLHGTEFTADCLVDRDGRPSAVLRRRELVKNGLAVVSTTFDDAAVRAEVVNTLKAVHATGLCCVQGFIADDARVTITELNVRAAGGFALSEAAGADLVGQMVRGLFDLPVDHDRLTYQPGMFLANAIKTLHVGHADELAVLHLTTGALT